MQFLTSPIKAGVYNRLLHRLGGVTGIKLVVISQAKPMHGFSRNIHFIALIHPIQWTIANPVGADRPAKRQKKTSCVTTGWPVRSTVHSPDGASYLLPV